MRLYPHRLPGESRPGRPLPPHPSDPPPPQDPQPEPPQPEPDGRLGAGYALMVLRESAVVLGALCALMVLPWP
ncbi:hypothetical protein AB0J86_27225 [Micromonospora sp. NPDC049559]|uniref:hypothetical protein n=1 Tax=Micromonospora sp. NPDC049559 TaxID=3155923 RepID=UPI003432001C